MNIRNNESVKNVEQLIAAQVERNKQREKDLLTLGEMLIMAALTKDGNKNGLS